MMMHCCKKSDGTEKEEVEMIDMTSYMDDPFLRIDPEYVLSYYVGMYELHCRRICLV